MARTTKKKKKSEGPEAMSFEEAVTELEAIIERIELGEIGLEESLAERKRGEALIHRTRAILDSAEQQLEELAGADMGADMRADMRADRPETSGAEPPAQES